MKGLHTLDLQEGVCLRVRLDLDLNLMWARFAEGCWRGL